MGPKTVALLSYLVEHRDRVISKTELRKGIPDVELPSDAILTTMLTKLRRALGHEHGTTGPIEAVSGQGYRFRAEPMAETSEMSEAIQPPEVPDEPLVGRDSTLNVLRERLTRADLRAEAVLLLLGEAGIGKTRVARALCGLARAEELCALFVPAHDGRYPSPYWPWSQLLRAAHDALGPELFERCLPRIAWPLSQLVPDLHEGTAVAPSMEPQAARFCLFEAFASFLKRAAAEQSLLIVLDDVHCADEGTIELLLFLAHALQGQRVTIVATLCTGRSKEPWHTDARFGRLSSVSAVIELAGLSIDAVAELAAAHSEAERPKLALALHARTRGNPLFVRQIIDFVRQGGCWSFDAEAEAETDTAQALACFILRRLRELPPASRAAISAAAVIGRSFDQAILAAVLSVNVRQVFELLKPALQMRLIDSNTLPGSGLSFAHALVCDGVYEELTPRERGELHGRVARVLAERREQRSRDQAVIAHHWLHAVPTDLGAAVAACRNAAATSRAAASFEISTQLLSAALAKIEQLGGDAELRFRVLLELGEDHFYAGQSQAAWTAFCRASECVLGSARIDLLVQVVPRLLDCLEFGYGDQNFVHNAIEQALASSSVWPDHVKACLYAYRSVQACEQPADARRALAERAASLAERSGSLEAKLEVAHARATTRDPRALAESMVAAQDFIKLAERYPHEAARMRYRALRGFGAHLTRYLCALTTCDLAAADLYLEQCRQVAQSSHVPLVQFVVGLARAGRALGEGRLVELRELVSRLSPHGDGEGAVGCEAWRWYRFALMEAQGHASLEILAADAVLLENPASYRFAAQAAIVRARQFASNGHLRRARALLALVPRQWVAAMPVNSGDLGILCALAELQLLLGDRAAAEELYRKLSPFAAYNAVGPLFDYRGAVAHFLGLLARRAGDESSAIVHFRQAVAINRKLNMPRQLAASEVELSAREQRAERSSV